MSRQDRIGTHKTSIFTDEHGALCVKYHATVVAKRNADGSIVLNGGGYRTATTKTRINQALHTWGSDWFVYQKDFNWYARNPRTEKDFADGMVLS